MRRTVKMPSAVRKSIFAGLLALGVFGGGLQYVSPALAAGLPEATVGAATEVMAGSATLHATVTLNEMPLENCFFQYESASQSAYRSGPRCFPELGAGNQPVVLTASVTGLAADTAYRYRLVVIPAEGPEEGERLFSQPSELFMTPPTVVGSALASNVTSFAATLTGVVGSGELTPNYHFAYGTDSSYGLSAPVPDANGGAGGLQTVSQTITGLQPDTVYHFALVVSNFGGSVNVGPDATFTTRPLVPPQAISGEATGVGQNTVTLSGAVNPEGLDTTYQFQYGTSTAYTATWPSIAAHAGSGDGSEATAVVVENLQPGTVYHYRLVASNEDGTTYGADRTFTTAEHLVSAIQVAPVAAPNPAILAAAREAAKGVIVKPAKHAKHAGRRKKRTRAKRKKR